MKVEACFEIVVGVLILLCGLGVAPVIQWEYYWEQLVLSILIALIGCLVVGLGCNRLSKAKLKESENKY